MKHTILSILTFLCVSIFYGQQQFKTHAVKEGETLEQIARKYSVTPYNILRYNPEAKEGLSPNTILVIPVAGDEGGDIVLKTDPSEGGLAQEREVERFVRHKVKKRETLYSLAQKYNVSEEDIKRYNKQLYSRMPRKGERLEIPVFKVAASPAGWQVPADGLVPYVVKTAEGKWRIAYEHGISQEELDSLNPEMKEVLQEGDTLMVPFVAGNEKFNVVDSLYNYYEVKPKEGFYRLKIKLGLTQEELERLNPELKEKGLQKGMILRVPEEVTANMVLNNGMLLERFALADSIQVPATTNLGLVMPFDLNSVRYDSVQRTRENIRNSPLLNISLDFYSGVIVAMDSLKRMGISVNLEVFDSGDRDAFLRQLPSNPELRQKDAIIGPVQTPTINALTAYLEPAGVPVFAPFTNKGLQMRSNVYQTLPPDALMRSEMLQYLENYGQEKNVVIIADDKNAGVKGRLNSIFPQAWVVDTLSKRFLRLDNLRPLLSTEKENWVILESSSFNLIGNVTAVVNSAVNDSTAVTLLTTLRGNVYDNKNISNLHLSNLKFHYPTFYKPVNEPTVFHKHYERKFGAAPNRYATRGFDLAMDVILRLAYNKDMELVARKVGETAYVENKFNYQRDYGGGFVNRALYVVRFEDLNIIEVDQNAPLLSEMEDDPEDTKPQKN